jgi:hypothetical protein
MIEEIFVDESGAEMSIGAPFTKRCIFGTFTHFFDVQNWAGERNTQKC